MKKRMIKLTGALLLVASLVFSGCGKSTQLDDYATNEGSDSVEEGTEAVRITHWVIPGGYRRMRLR